MSPERGDDQLTEAESLRAWLRDTQGHHGTESFNKTVLNRKTGQMEQRLHVWVLTGFERKKSEETRTTKTTSLLNQTKDYTSAQLQEANNRVFSFASWRGPSESGRKHILHSFLCWLPSV